MCNGTEQWRRLAERALYFPPNLQYNTRTRRGKLANLFTIVIICFSKSGPVDGVHSFMFVFRPVTICVNIINIDQIIITDYNKNF